MIGVIIVRQRWLSTTRGSSKRPPGGEPLLTQGRRVALVEDVITTGGSAARAVEAVRREGAVPVGILALVDREEGGREALESLGIEVRTLATASEIIPYIAASGPTAGASTPEGSGS